MATALSGHQFPSHQLSVKNANGNNKRNSNFNRMTREKENLDSEAFLFPRAESSRPDELGHRPSGHPCDVSARE